ncbi:MAG TPA: glycosyltransferase [Candidatus Bathyarchaeota archaeon]|nr:glycosyltransferase [Candidatus Bathyarchaeota archaeon]
MSTISLNKLSLKNYAKIIGEKEIEHIHALANKLAGKSVVHVSSTAFGGGVAEMLHRVVPLMKDVGLDAEWKVIRGEKEFFDVTKSFHNALQGMETDLTADMKRTYLQYNELNVGLLDLDYDYVVIHDPQPLALIDYQPKNRGKWIWRCHIDLSKPNQVFWRFLEPFLANYDAYIFTAKEYVKSPLENRNVALITPSIDPLSNKSKCLPENQILSVLESYNVDPENPLVNQVARFDPWKDPLGVIDTYRKVKKKMPKLQLLLISSMAMDDPEGWLYFERTARHAGEDPDIHLLTDLKGVGDLEVNAFQSASDVALLKSIREGFGLTVTESLWKEVPVVGGNVGGIPLQIIDGETGFLVNTVEEAVEKTFYILKHPEEAKKMGKKGKEHVKENFLITRHLKKYLELFLSLTKSR